MSNENDKITNLRSMLDSYAFDSFQGDRLGNILFLNDPERADRCHEAAKDGADGSTHAECIQDWRDFLETLGSEIGDETYALIEQEIDDCEAWHEKNGSLHEQLG